MRPVRYVEGPTPSKEPSRAVVKRMALEGKSVQEMVRVLDISTQAVQYHLKALRAAGELREAAS